MNVLEEAAGLINGDRQEQYGNATESHTRIADLWAAYLNTDVTEFDVVNMMVLLKVSRTRNTYHRDSYVDIAGYAGLGERLFDESADEVVSKFDLYVDRLRANLPRVWQAQKDIPRGVAVVDRDGDDWLPDQISSRFSFSQWGPYTEVLETDA